MSYINSMYGGSSYYSPSPSIPKPKQPENDKSASRILGGMKVHNSHIKRVEVDGDLVDIPRIEYVKLLEQQVKDMRLKCSNLEAKVDRLQEVTRNLSMEIKAVQRDSVQKRSIGGMRYTNRR